MSPGQTPTTKKREPKDPHAVATGRLIEQAIEESGMSKGVVAERARRFDPTVHQPTLSMFISGVRKPKAKQLDAIARALGIPVAKLHPGDRELQAVSSPNPENQAAPGTDRPAGSGDVSRVGVAIRDYIRRQGREPDHEELEIIESWLKANPPPILDDELIAGLLDELRRSFRRAAQRLAASRGDGGPGSHGG